MVIGRIANRCSASVRNRSGSAERSTASTGPLAPAGSRRSAQVAQDSSAPTSARRTSNSIPPVCTEWFDGGVNENENVLQSAFDRYVSAVDEIVATGEWSKFADLFTEDATYCE